MNAAQDRRRWIGLREASVQQWTQTETTMIKKEKTGLCCPTLQM